MAVVAVALALGRPLLLLGLLVPVLVLAAVELWWRSPTNRRSRVSSRDDDFTQVLARLQAVRDELRTTTSPERVAVLRTLADELVADGERLLGVHLREPAPTGVPAPVEQPVDGGRRRRRRGAPAGADAPRRGSSRTYLTASRASTRPSP